MHAETVLTPADLIWPLFVTEGSEEEPIASLPGVSRWSIKAVAERAKEAAALGIPCVALFPNTPAGLRSDDGREALNPDNLMCRAIRAIKDAVPDIGILTDVALDPYTAHGQDGLLDPTGYVVNDATIDVLIGQSLNQAAAGADIIAPSDMMDGRVGALRAALDEEDFTNTAIIAYSAKFASAFYGPFRDAADSAPQPDGHIKEDRRGYQMDPANAREAVREALLDVDEGADIVMVKPGLPYLDVVRQVRDAVRTPVAVYNVSGEYSMLKAAAANGYLDEQSAVAESLLAMRRAGADIIFTYHAKDFAQWQTQ
jgi:porphobilinogen synthase